MADMNLLDDEAFGIARLTDLINDDATPPGQISESGLFEEDGIDTLHFEIERSGDTLELVAAADRGAPGQVVHGGSRDLIPFKLIHLPQTATIMADEVQNVRAFGSRTELQGLEDLILKRGRKMRAQLDSTMEFHRLGALRGMILDKDGSTVLLDIYERFGFKQPVMKFDLDKSETKVRVKCTELKDKIEDGLNGRLYREIEVWCETEFWSKLLTFPDVEKSYLNTEAAKILREELSEDFVYAGIRWRRYKGKMRLPDGSYSPGFLPKGEAVAFPSGVSEGFVTRFGPANYAETVNTTGLPYYMRQERLRMNKGVELEVQSNTLHLPKIPRAIVRLTVQ